MAQSTDDLAPGVRAALLACHRLRTQQRESESESEYFQRHILKMINAMNKLIPVVLLAVLVGCGSSGGKGSNGWPMDPRLANLAQWAYACMLDVTGLKPGEMPVPNVRGVDEPWGPEKNKIGSFFIGSRFIQVQITRPYSHLVNIMLHEMGHDGDARVNGETVNEDYAVWVRQQCSEALRPDIYPAPPVDWDAMTRHPSPRPGGSGKPRQGRDEK